jgi:hypothetical protein
MDKNLVTQRNHAAKARIGRQVDVDGEVFVLNKNVKDALAGLIVARANLSQ